MLNASKPLAAHLPRLDPAWPALDTVLECARRLGHAPMSGSRPTPFKHRNLVLLCASRHVAGLEDFRNAASGLGANVAVLVSDLHLNSAPQTVEDTARLLSRLYDAVVCDGLPDAVVDRLARSATVAVRAGYIGAAAHADALAQHLAGADPLQHKRHRILQALVMQSMS